MSNTTRHLAPRSVPTYYTTTILYIKCMDKLFLIQAHDSLHVVQLHEKVDIEQYKKRGKYYKSRKCAKHNQERFSLGCADCREVFCALCVPAAIKPGSCHKTGETVLLNMFGAPKFTGKLCRM